MEDGAMKLETRSLFTRWQYMYSIMATSTKNNPISYFVSKFRVVFPGFNMMHNELSRVKWLFAFLANRAVSGNTEVTPFYIQDSIPPSFTTKIIFSFLTLSNTLYRAISFICTRSRAINSSLTFINWRLKDFSASEAVFKYLLGHQWYVNMGVI